MKVLVSACLLGEAVRYDGKSKRITHPVLARWQQQNQVVAFCPEVKAGLAVPRPRAEIEPGATADDVLAGRAHVRTEQGEICTDAFIAGAELALAVCLREKIRVAVLKEKSPSCGVHCIAQGDFSGNTRKGAGITTRLLQRHGIAVFNEDEIDQADALLRSLAMACRAS